MKISYNKLWKMLIDRKMNKTDLREKTKMGSNTMAKLGRDETISMDVMAPKSLPFSPTLVLTITILSSSLPLNSSAAALS